MGKPPSSLIPIPKQVELTPGVRAWPRRISISCDAPDAAPLTARYQADLQGRGQGELVIRLVRTDCRTGGYNLRLNEAEVTVEAGETSGFRHALQTLLQLATAGPIPHGTIRDWPALQVRGFHLNLENIGSLQMEQALQIVELAARVKLNTLLVEYGPRFPFLSRPELRDTNCLTPEDVARLNDAAGDLGIRLIPLQQSLAHLEFALKHEGLAHLRERPQKPNMMCPQAPGSMELFKSLAGDIMKSHPGADLFHIGGDEARKIGSCSRCKPVVKREGVGKVIGRHLGEAARWVLQQDKCPVVWDDTLCAVPDAFEYLPKETIICYWDYIAVANPSPVLIPRMSHAAGGPRVAHDWRWTLKTARGRVSDVQFEVMKHYSKPVRLKTALGKPFLEKFARYLGSGFPKWIRALPYMEYYQDLGHEVISCPTGMGNGDTRDGLPNYSRFARNILTHAGRCRENGKALGIITTAWYNVPPELLHQPLIQTAQSAW